MGHRKRQAVSDQETPQVEEGSNRIGSGLGTPLKRENTISANRAESRDSTEVNVQRDKVEGQGCIGKPNNPERK
jgi:hypothetical protein